MIRRAEQADLAAVETLLTESDLPTAGVREAFEHFLVAEQGDAVTGAIGLEVFDDASGKTALLRSAVVAPEARGTGLGSELVQQVMELADRLHVTDLYLLTTTAEEYFPRFGFKRTTRDVPSEGVRNSVEFRGACPASATVMVRAMGSMNRGGQERIPH